MTILVLALFTALWPAAASAQDLSPDQIGQTFAQAGYTVDAPTASSDGVTNVSIHAANGETPGWPTVRALIYTDSAAAQQARTQDQILAGYGTPFWNGNVAIIQRSTNPDAFPHDDDCSSMQQPQPVLDTVSDQFSSILLGRGGNL